MPHRFALIHALAHSVAPISAGFERAVPSRPPVDFAGLASWLGRHFNRGLPRSGRSGSAQRVHGYDAEWAVLLNARLRV